IKIRFDLIDAKGGKVKVPAGTKITARQARKLEEDGLKEIVVQNEELVGAYVARAIADDKTGEVAFEAGEELDVKSIEKIEKLGLKTLEVLAIDHINVGPYIRNTLAADKCRNREDALVDIYRVMRPGEPPTLESA